VQFSASGTDATTGRPGSITTITGKGAPVEVRRGAEVERLPNIPTQLGLTVDSFDVAEIPSDDLDQAVTKIADTIAGRARLVGSRMQPRPHPVLSVRGGRIR
jgi:hypothetical protein